MHLSEYQDVGVWRRPSVSTLVHIAVGDNLVQKPFATDIMKLNKSFFINRTGENAKQIYKALMKASMPNLAL